MSTSPKAPSATSNAAVSQMNQFASKVGDYGVPIIYGVLVAVSIPVIGALSAQTGTSSAQWIASIILAILITALNSIKSVEKIVGLVSPVTSNKWGGIVLGHLVSYIVLVLLVMAAFVISRKVDDEYRQRVGA